MFLIQISLILFYITHIYSKKYPCIGNDKCYAETIICDKEQDCYVECSGSQACRDTTIICPPGFACNILCHTSPLTDLTTNELTCYKMIINATQSTILNFSTNLGETGEALPNPRTFEDGQIFCPHNGRSGGIKPCNIYCNGDDLMRRFIIYAVEGFNDVHIVSNHYDKLWCTRGGIMRCLEDFSADCKITNEAINGTFQCYNWSGYMEDKTCMNYTIVTEIPTPNPTSIPIISTQSQTTNIIEVRGESGDNDNSIQLMLILLLPLLALAVSMEHY
eukprot:497988_1